MRNGPFLLFVVVVFFAQLTLYFWLRGTLNSDDRVYKAEVSRLTKEKERASLQAKLAEYELSDWKQATAQLIPESLKAKLPTSNYPLRSMASVVIGDLGSKLEIESGASLFERAKQEFRKQNYSDAADGFELLLGRYPSSRYVVESHFLLAESRYRLANDQAAIDSIEAMVGNFPESELTGFALLRLAEIYEKHDRREDAAEIYAAIIGSYNNADLIAQAKVGLKADDL